MAGSIIHRLAAPLRAGPKSWLFRLVLGLLLLLCLVQLARLIWLLVTPFGPVGDWQGRSVNAMPATARQALFSNFDPHFREGVSNAGGPATVTSLQYTLYGIRMNVGSGGGSAIIAGSDGVQNSYAIGEEISDGVKLAGVEFDHVLLDRGGRTELLYLDQSVPAQTAGAQPNTPAPSTPPAAPGSAPETPTADTIKSSVGFAPRNVNGKITGIVLAPQGDGAIFNAAGFQNGDIVTEFNGRAIRSAADIEALRGAIRPGAKLSVMVERGANTVPIVINLDNQ